MIRSMQWRTARSRAVLARDGQRAALQALNECAARRGAAELDALLARYRAAAAAADEAQAAFEHLHYPSGRWWLH